MIISKTMKMPLVKPDMEATIDSKSENRMKR